jgi:phosphoenolpyruvate synthase/pyruvate phosphate dikinase
MAVLIQEMVAPELCFVMHTADPLTGDRDQAWVELAVGLGETLVSARQPGTPYRLVCRHASGETRLEACASFSLALEPAPQGGAREERIDYSQVALSADPSRAQQLGRQLAKVAAYLERELGGPQDVEGAIVGDTIHLVQTRPQQGLQPSANR